MKNNDIQQLSSKDLVEKIGEEKLEMQKLKINHVISPIEKPHTIKVMRRNIARLMTELTKREINGNK